MGKGTKQAEAASHIRELLLKQGFDIPSSNISLKDDQRWMIFELNQRQIGIDSASGVWVKSLDSDWRCLSLPATISGAVMAVDFLLKEQ